MRAADGAGAYLPVLLAMQARDVRVVVGRLCALVLGEGQAIGEAIALACTVQAFQSLSQSEDSMKAALMLIATELVR